MCVMACVMAFLGTINAARLNWNAAVLFSKLVEKGLANSHTFGHQAFAAAQIFADLLNRFVWKCWVIPNEIAIFHRDNDQQNHWV